MYLPPGYEESTARYPVLYLQDGQNLFDPGTAFNGNDWRADITADELIVAGAAAPLIIAGVYNTGVRRISEYTPTRDPVRRKGGKGDRYAQMLARELKPFLDARYRTAKSGHAVGGSSLGGLVSLEAALLYPRVFPKVAVLSPSVWWDRRSILGMVAQYRGSERPRVWLDTGTHEGDGVVEDARLLRDALQEKGFPVCYSEFQGAGHNEQAWGARLGDVLRWLYPPT